MKKARIAFAFLSPLALLLLLLLPLSASAHSTTSALSDVKTPLPSIPCSHKSCNDKDPRQAICSAKCGSGNRHYPDNTRCKVDAYIATHPASLSDDQGHLLFTVYNWYSPPCGTNWNQTITTRAAKGIRVGIYIPFTNTFPYWFPIQHGTQVTYYTGGLSPAWSNMVYAPVVEACAITEVSNNLTGENFAGSCI